MRMATIERRVATDGMVRFRVKIRLAGLPAQSATFPRLSDARAWAR